MPRLWTLVLCLTWTCLSGAAEAGDRMQIYLVRHAEPKASGSGGPPGSDLANSGLVRAKALADIAVKAGVCRIYVSEYARTQQTAAPSAERLKLTPIKESQDEVSRAKIVKQIQGMKAAAVVLIVGHTDTVPDLIKLLGAPPPSEIRHDEFNKMFIVTIDKCKASLVSTTYGPAPEQ